MSDYRNDFMCVTCGVGPLTPEQLGVHLKEAHKLDAATTKGTRSMRCHVDASTWFSYEYDWDIQGVKLLQCTKQPRSPSPYWGNEE